MPFTADILTAVHEELISELERESNYGKQITRAFLEERFVSIVKRHDATNQLSSAEREEIITGLINRVVGFGPLTGLLSDPTVTEIMVNGMAAVYVERAGRLQRENIIFTNEAEILRIINRMVSRVGRRIDESSPLVDARLPDGSRVNAIIPPLSRAGPILTVRRFPTVAFTLEKLVATGTLSNVMADWLSSAVKAKRNVIISGGTGSGKTTTLNALAAEVGAEERLISIEDTAEIRLLHPHLVQLEARLPNVEGTGEVTIRTLLKNALRMRPDRIIIGEVRGGEALDMLQAMNTGHQGSLTTIHANAPEEALFRLETMAMMADISLPLFAIREQVRSSIQLVVQQARLADGSRKIVAISQLIVQRNALGELSPYALRPLFIFDTVKRIFTSLHFTPA